MSVHGVSAALKVGMDKRNSFKFGRIKWKRVHFAIGDRWYRCPICGLCADSLRAKALHEMYEVRVLTVFRLVGLEFDDEIDPEDR